MKKETKKETKDKERKEGRKEGRKTERKEKWVVSHDVIKTVYIARLS